MKILILEDDKNRFKIFEKIFSKHDLIFAETVEEAIKQVEENGPFDVYFLDHDLGGKAFVLSSEKNTGYQFARYLFEKKINAYFYIHSLNYPGAQNIMSILKVSTYIPIILFNQYRWENESWFN